MTLSSATRISLLLKSIDINSSFCFCRFKTAEIANEFKNAFDDAKQGKGKVLDLPPTPIKVRERTDSSSRDSTRERKDSARERKDSAKERERRHSAGKSESPDKVKATTNLESFSFKPQSTSASGTNTSTPKVSFTFGSSGRQNVSCYKYPFLQEKMVIFAQSSFSVFRLASVFSFWWIIIYHCSSWEIHLWIRCFYLKWFQLWNNAHKAGISC